MSLIQNQIKLLLTRETKCTNSSFFLVKKDCLKNKKTKKGIVVQTNSENKFKILKHSCEKNVINTRDLYKIVNSSDSIKNNIEWNSEKELDQHKEITSDHSADKEDSDHSENTSKINNSDDSDKTEYLRHLGLLLFVLKPGIYLLFYLN